MTIEDPKSVTLPKAGTIRNIRVNGSPEQAGGWEVQMGDKISVTVEPHQVSAPAEQTVHPTYGWRLLGPREIVQAGDMCCWVMTSDEPCWASVCSTIGRTAQANPEFAYQRKLALPPTCYDDVSLAMFNVVERVDPYAEHRCDLQTRKIEAISGCYGESLYHVPGIGISAEPKTLTVYGPDSSGDDVCANVTPTYKPWTKR